MAQLPDTAVVETLLNDGAGQVSVTVATGAGSGQPVHLSEFMMTLQTPETTESQLLHAISPGPEPPI